MRQSIPGHSLLADIAMAATRRVPKSQGRVVTTIRPTPDQHLQWKWGARVAGLSLSRFAMEAIEEKCKRTLAEHGEYPPFDLDPRLDEPGFY